MELPKAVAAPPRALTDKEEEYLEYFTDYCKYTDDPKEYGIDTRAAAGSKSQTFRQDKHTSIMIDDRDVKKVTRVGGLHYLQKIIMWNM